MRAKSRIVKKTHRAQTLVEWRALDKVGEDRETQYKGAHVHQFGRAEEKKDGSLSGPICLVDLEALLERRRILGIKVIQRLALKPIHSHDKRETN